MSPTQGENHNPGKREYRAVGGAATMVVGMSLLAYSSLPARLRARLAGIQTISIHNIRLSATTSYNLLRLTRALALRISLTLKRTCARAVRRMRRDSQQTAGSGQ